ncbi:ferrochelatase [Halieaceae bacterium IMCC14734]|uniref:Ferrochelatase n=1 Tax=Candidatus Litorirhabdus singularis TaxID=2518993 RepID=A0ABT3TIM0_9GAMM|nr:ferrochelatase [Candidatus Litorirhabdus singularis]MCX2982182.1 ferrochelatase [Candidatus Litorirhabdus singularis]
MAFKNQKDFQHQQPPRIGVLLTNLGTPEAPTAGAVRPWLRQFLSDPRVVEIPRAVWWFILNCIILLVRPRKSAANYRKIWMEEGSPLLHYTREQASALDEKLRAECGDHIVVEYAFRYGEPSLATALERLSQQGVRKLLVLPLFPQYSAATGASTFDALAADFNRRRWLPDLRFVTHYHDYPPYIMALSSSIRSHWQAHGRADKLVLSYHGLPKRQLELGDPYFCECQKTSRLLAQELGLAEDEILTTFQSRFGAAEWLQPYTEGTVRELAAAGTQSIQIVCPGFSSDCLETLEEIDMQIRDVFLEGGGERFEYIPALNASPGHIEVLADLVKENLQGWEVGVDDPQETHENARKLGAKQ